MRYWVCSKESNFSIMVSMLSCDPVIMVSDHDIDLFSHMVAYTSHFSILTMLWTMCYKNLPLMMWKLISHITHIHNFESNLFHKLSFPYASLLLIKYKWVNLYYFLTHLTLQTLMLLNGGTMTAMEEWYAGFFANFHRRFLTYRVHITIKGIFS